MPGEYNKYLLATVKLMAVDTARLYKWDKLKLGEFYMDVVHGKPPKGFARPTKTRRALSKVFEGVLNIQQSVKRLEATRIYVARFP